MKTRSVGSSVGLSALMALASCGQGADPSETSAEPNVGRTSTELATHRNLTVCSAGCDYAQIQPAVDEARSGDTVWVSSGAYDGQIVIADKSISLKGDGPRTTTIAVGAPVVDVRCTIPLKVVISGFTITNGGGTAGGLRNDGCALTLRDAAVTSCGVHAFGAGIRNMGGTLVASDVRIEKNVARGAGGGIFNALGATLHLRDAQILSNTAGTGGGGGILNEGVLVVSDSVLSKNQGKHGGGASSSGTCTMRDTHVIDNLAFGGGGGVESSGALVLIGSRIARNSAGMAGGGVDIVGGTADIVRTPVRANVPDDCAGITCL